MYVSMFVCFNSYIRCYTDCIDTREVAGEYMNIYAFVYMCMYICMYRYFHTYVYVHSTM
jgi:hypothetical protein